MLSVEIKESWRKLQGVKVNPKIEAEIIRLYTVERKNVWDIGELVQLSGQTVYRVLKRRGIPRDLKELPPPDLTNLKGWELGYIAAFLDGEGSIKWITGSNKKRAQLSASQVVPAPLRFIQSKLGGKVNKLRRPRCRQGYCYYWTLNGKNEVITVLKVLLPYLIVKRKKAKEVIEIMEKEYGAS